MTPSVPFAFVTQFTLEDTNSNFYPGKDVVFSLFSVALVCFYL